MLICGNCETENENFRLLCKCCGEELYREGGFTAEPDFEDGLTRYPFFSVKDAAAAVSVYISALRADSLRVYADDLVDLLYRIETLEFPRKYLTALLYGLSSLRAHLVEHFPDAPMPDSLLARIRNALLELEIREKLQ